MATATTAICSTLHYYCPQIPRNYYPTHLHCFICTFFPGISHVFNSPYPADFRLQRHPWVSLTSAFQLTSLSNSVVSHLIRHLKRIDCSADIVVFICFSPTVSQSITYILFCSSCSYVRSKEYPVLFNEDTLKVEPRPSSRNAALTERKMVRGIRYSVSGKHKVVSPSNPCNHLIVYLLTMQNARDIEDRPSKEAILAETYLCRFFRKGRDCGF
jgi:hypothetical protein